MVNFEFHPTIKGVTPVQETSEPYIKVRIDSTNKSWYHHSHFPNWARSASCKQFNYNNEGWIGLDATNSATSVDFTKTIDLPGDSFYRVEVMMAEGSTDTGNIKLYINDTQIGEPVYPKTVMSDIKRRVQFPTVYLADGNNDFKITLTNKCFIAWIMIFKIDRREGGTAHQTDANTTRLDIISGSFTQNTVTETNLLDLKIIMKQEYYDDNNLRSLLKFDYNDHITLWLGKDYTDAKPMYGGYITDLSVDTNAKELTIGCEDRLFDFKRKPVYKNFKIGNAATDSTTDTTPFTQFSDAYSMIRALAQTPEYPINTYMVPYDYGFKQSFQSIEEYDEVTSTIFRTEWDTTQGKNKPSLKIGLLGDTGDAEVVLYSDNIGWDAAVYDHFNFSYYTGGAGSRYPLQFNIEIDMYKAGQTVADIKTYTIHINGPSVTSYLLASTDLVLNGKWNDKTLNLKELFDAKYPSTEYWITGIRIVGNVTNDMLISRRCATIWIDSIQSYKHIVSTANHASQDVKTPFEELQGVCEDCNLAAYVRYGEERIDDVLVVVPDGTNIVAESAEEGRNLLKINDWEYNPLDDDFVNQSYNTFNIDDTHSTSSYSEDHDSVLWYGAYQKFEHLSSTMSQTQGDAYAKNKVTVGAWKDFGTSIEIPGCVVLEPSQFILVQAGTRHIQGQQQIKTIKHEFKLQDTITYITTIELNRTGDIYNNYLKSLAKDIRNSGVKGTVQTYTDGNLYNASGIGSGVYTGG